MTTDDVDGAESAIANVVSPTKIRVKWRGRGYSESTEELWEDVRAYAEPGEGHFDDELRTGVARCVRRLVAGGRVPKATLTKKGEDEVKAAVPLLPRRRRADEEDALLSLKSYQVEGAAWLCFNLLNRRSCILADEMGLGKTVQTVTLVRMAKLQCGASAPALIIAPLSTLAHWQREFDRWSSLDVAVYHGSPDDRAACRDLDILNSGVQKKVAVDVVITTPEQIL